MAVAASFIIRVADLDDARVLGLLEAHLRFARAGTAQDSAHALDAPQLRAHDMQAWTAWDGASLLGIGALKRLSATHGEIKSMHVAAVARRRGVGNALLAHIIAAARAQGLARVSLETGSWSDFEPARTMYRRYGFVECQPFGDYDPDVNSVFMRLDL